MKYIDVKTTDPAFNLALEQYVFDELSENDDIFLLWQNDNAIIIGKNQNTYLEINTDYVKQNKIRVVRRLSGGGAVYHDLGNLNFTFIMREKEKQFDFSKFCRPVVTALKKLGVTAEINGRNDMVIDGKKFSGNAQYFKNGKIMHHGTLMYDSNLEVVSNALNVSQEKMITKGVKSIKSHVTNIRPYMENKNIPIREFKKLLVEHMFEETNLTEYHLTEEDFSRVQEIANAIYETWEWNYGKSPQYEICRKIRLEGCGQIELCMNIENECIADFDIYGDYFSYKDKEGLCNAVNGSALLKEELIRRLEDIDVASYIHNLTVNGLLQLILGNEEP